MKIMGDGASPGEMSDRDWMLDQEVDEGPVLIVSAEHRSDIGAATDESAGAVDAGEVGVPSGDFAAVCGHPHDLDGPAPDSAGQVPGCDVNGGAKRAAVRLGLGVLLAAVVIVAVLVVFGGGPDPAPVPQHHPLTPAVAAAPTTPSLVMPQQDHAVPFTARTDSCSPPGSGDQPAARSPQALTDTGTDSAWVCGRGPQESLLDGQVLQVQFVCDAARSGSDCSYMLTSVAVTPGWVAKTPAGSDEWLQHRVVARLQFNFFNGNRLAADPFFVDTHSVHGPVTAALPAKILASRVQVIILHTERPPAAPLPAATAPDRGPDITAPQSTGGVGDWLLEPPTGEPAAPPPSDDPGAGAAGDPVDATFAMSRLQFFGHSPT